MVLTGSALIAVTLGISAVAWTGGNFMKGIYMGCISSNADAQAFLTRDRNCPFMVDAFELGVSAANMVKYGSTSLQFHQ